MKAQLHDRAPVCHAFRLRSCGDQLATVTPGPNLLRKGADPVRKNSFATLPITLALVAAALASVAPMAAAAPPPVGVRWSPCHR